jgi:site-specific recombinase XerD
MSNLPTITLSKAYHKNASQILITFKYNPSLIDLAKNILNARWSETLKGWYLKNNPINLKHIYKVYKHHANINNTILFALPKSKKQNSEQKRKRQLTKIQRNILNGFYKYLLGKRYSKSTILTYTFFIADFVEYYTNTTLKNLNNKDVELFIEDIFIKKQYSISTQRQFISALKQFIIFYPNTGINQIELTRPKKSKKLPIVLSQEEIISIIQHTKNLKHRTIIALLYSAGLRISELINLRLIDFEIQRKQIHIKSGKGRRDRYVMIADTFIPLLKNYIATYQPKLYCIENPNGGKYSDSSIRKMLHHSCIRAGIKKHVTPHTLRHSYATHLLEQGVGIRFIQELLGHSKPETTMIYTHITRKDLLSIKSPLDTALMQLSKKNNLEQKFLLSGK